MVESTWRSRLVASKLKKVVGTMRDIVAENKRLRALVEPTKVWVVMYWNDYEGANEPDSAWITKEEAETECARLNELPGRRGGDWAVSEVEMKRK